MGDESTQGLSFQSTSIGDTSGNTSAEVNSLTAENREDQDIITAAATLQRLSAQAASINLSRETTNMEVGSTSEGVTTHQCRAPVAPTFTGLGRRGYRHRSSHHARTNTQQCHGDPKSSAPKPSARPSNREGQTSNPAPEVSRSGSNDPTSTKKTGKIQTEQSDSSSKSKKTRPRWVEDPNSERGKRLLGVPPFMLNNNIDAANMVESDARTGRPRRNIRGGPSGPTASEQLTVPPVQQPPENDNVNGEAGDDDVGKESGDIDQNKRIDGDDAAGFVIVGYKPLFTYFEFERRNNGIVE
ncbi:uncharacterized protein RCO7_08389 [Rhynchosporium graminicola]|uniref:Uncharacterized protein n=1 Tax=Rhynchosporium graminicola TaxID=2792576 RepID=A0A1E1KQB3_9HELO|nr:uncharacterized protein RCO7_08389 [Rhynchosporium commune]